MTKEDSFTFEVSKPEITRLLNTIKEAIDVNPDIDVRIILGKLFNADDVPKEKANSIWQAADNVRLGLLPC